MILLDTVVVSELRKRQPQPEVVSWLRAQRPDDLFVSVLTLGEIERGIVKVVDVDARSARALANWLDDLIALYADLVLPVTPRIVRRWGRLTASPGHDGTDLMIAATALCHGLSVATRTVGHFAQIGVSVVIPFAD